VDVEDLDVDMEEVQVSTDKVGCCNPKPLTPQLVLTAPGFRA